MGLGVQGLIGWWIGKRRGWIPETRTYGTRSGYLIRLTNRIYWWDGEKLTEIVEE
jgi:hypothetical protein